MTTVPSPGALAIFDFTPEGIGSLAQVGESVASRNRFFVEAFAPVARFERDLGRIASDPAFDAVALGVAGGDDWELVETLLEAMAEGEADFTLVFRHLAGALESGEDETVVNLFSEPGAIAAWLGAWRRRLEGVDRGEALAVMRRCNPVFIPRNHRIEEAIVAGNGGDFDPFYRLNEVLRRPFEERAKFAAYEAAPTAREVVQATFCGT